MQQFQMSNRIYANALSQASDLDGWRFEGQPVTSYPQGALRLENALASEAGQAANYVLWCPEQFPADIAVRWRFRPLREPGLAMFWCRARGREGKDLFDSSLAPRHGEYRQYFAGDIDALHASYFRRKQPEERRFHTCNLRKSHGFHLVCQGADPIPSVDSIEDWLTVEMIVCGPWVQFSINDLVIYQWRDDGHQYGPVNDGPGYIGFRQMAPLIAEYQNLEIFSVQLHEGDQII